MKAIKLMSLAFLLAICTLVSGQYDYPGETEAEEKSSGRGKYYHSKFFFGGNLGLAFGTYSYVEISPIAGYKITPRFWAGLGPKYMYLKQPDYETHIYGLKAFALFTILKDLNETLNINLGDLFAYAENESLNLEAGYPTPQREWVNITLVGGGMRFPLGNRAGFSLFVLWDLTQDRYYSYSNPEIRVSFDF